MKGHLFGEDRRRGIYYALAAAIVSGFSIYINKFAVMQVNDPFLFTTAKNTVVALLLFSLLILPWGLAELRRLTRKQWATLALIGCIGGSIPFLLFFYGLKMASAPSAAFIHKTLFVWVGVLALLFLGERLGRLQGAALGMLVVGNLALLGRPTTWALGEAELMVLVATLLWAIEAVIAKRVMVGISPRVAAFGRMFFGSTIMLSYLAVKGEIGGLAVLNLSQIWAVVYTSLFLLGYVSLYYAGLKYTHASVVASILVFGSVITSLLYAIFDARRYSLEEVVGLLLVALAVWLLSARPWMVRRLAPEEVRR